MSGLMQILLLKVSAHITEQLGMAPGGEFREAFKEVTCQWLYCQTSNTDQLPKRCRFPSLEIKAGFCTQTELEALWKV